MHDEAGRGMALRDATDLLLRLESEPPAVLVVFAVRDTGTIKNLYVHANESEVYMALGVLEQVRNDLLASIPMNAHLRSRDVADADADEDDESTDAVEKVEN